MASAVMLATSDRAAISSMTEAVAVTEMALVTHSGWKRVTRPWARRTVSRSRSGVWDVSAADRSASIVDRRRWARVPCPAGPRSALAAMWTMTVSWASGRAAICWRNDVLIAMCGCGATGDAETTGETVSAAMRAASNGVSRPIGGLGRRTPARPGPGNFPAATASAAPRCARGARRRSRPKPRTPRRLRSRCWSTR